jgi:hypothetical protein
MKYNLFTSTLFYLRFVCCLFEDMYKDLQYS